MLSAYQSSTLKYYKTHLATLRAYVHCVDMVSTVGNQNINKQMPKLMVKMTTRTFQ